MLSKTVTMVALALTVLVSTTSVCEAGTLLVANKSDDTLDFLDPGSGESLATVDTGHAPHEVAVSENGVLAVVSNYGDRDEPGSTLTVLDVPSAAAVRTISLAPHTRPHGVAFVDEHRVVVTTEGSAHLLIVDIIRGQIEAAVSTDQEISHMVATDIEGRFAFVANIGSGSVTVVDLQARKKIKDIVTGEGAEGITSAPAGNAIWVTNRAADTLSVIDTRSLEVVATLPCPGFPIRIAMTPDGTRALISAARSGEVVVFDVERRRELTRTQLDLSNAPDAGSRLFGDRFGESPVPVGLVVDPQGSRAWVAATQADAVVAVEPETLGVRALLRAGHEPDGMAFSPLTAKGSDR